MDVFRYIKPQYIFLILSLYFNRQLSLVTPPLQAPDEFNHFYRAYQIAEGQWLPYTENKRLGGYIPGSIREYMLPFSNAATNIKFHLTSYDLAHAYNVPYHERDVKFMDFPNTSLYSPASYLPQAAALWISKKLGVSVAHMYEAGRISIFVSWLMAMFFVIRLIPVGKWLLTFLFLLPMNQYVANSFSADNMTNIAALLFVAVVLRASFRQGPVGKKELAFLALLLIVLAFAKVVYIGLVLLIWIIPKSRFVNTQQYYMTNLVLMTIALLAAYTWSSVVTSYYLPYENYNPNFRDGNWLSNCANYDKQKDYILGNALYFPEVIYRSMFEHPMYYFNGFIGIFGNSDVFLTRQLTYIAYFLIIAVALTEVNREDIGLKRRLFMFAGAFGSFVFLLLSQHLTWDCVGEGIVDLIQGRYLIPVLPVLFLLFANAHVRFRVLPMVIVLVFPVILNAYSATVISERYLKDTACWKHEFYCGAERKNEWNYFLTSQKGLELNGALSQSNEERRSGKQSAKLDKKNRFSYTYRFRNLDYGDIIEISGWQKGADVQLVLASRSKTCGQQYYSSSEVHFRDSTGWGKMQLLKTINKSCDSTEWVVFVWCPDSTRTAFFDDFKFSHRKYCSNYLNELKLK